MLAGCGHLPVTVPSKNEASWSYRCSPRPWRESINSRTTPGDDLRDTFVRAVESTTEVGTEWMSMRRPGPDKLISASSLARSTHAIPPGLSPLLDRATGMAFIRICVYPWPRPGAMAANNYRGPKSLALYPFEEKNESQY